MSDADLLRRAAALMRKRAENVAQVCPPPWVDSASPFASFGHSLVDNQGAELSSAAPVVLDHLASWHPAVALAVADWLDGFADETEVLNSHASDCRPCAPALAVARAYLGEPAEQVTG